MQKRTSRTGLKKTYHVTAGPSWMKIVLYEGTDTREAEEVYEAAVKASETPGAENFLLVVYLKSNLVNQKKRHDPRIKFGLVAA